MVDKSRLHDYRGCKGEYGYKLSGLNRLQVGINKYLQSKTSAKDNNRNLN